MPSLGPNSSAYSLRSTLKDGHRPLNTHGAHHSSTSTQISPGIVHEINANDTYNLVRLDLSIMVPNMRMEHFHTYQVYDEGTPALLHNNPVTIVGFIKNSAPDGFEIHGYYDLTIDQDPTKTIRQISAMTVHRYADRDEIFGEDSEL